MCKTASMACFPPPLGAQHQHPYNEAVMNSDDAGRPRPPNSQNELTGSHSRLRHNCSPLSPSCRWRLSCYRLYVWTMSRMLAVLPSIYIVDLYVSPGRWETASPYTNLIGHRVQETMLPESTASSSFAYLQRWQPCGCHRN